MQDIDNERKVEHKCSSDITDDVLCSKLLYLAGHKAKNIEYLKRSNYVISCN